MSSSVARDIDQPPRTVRGRGSMQYVSTVSSHSPSPESTDGNVANAKSINTAKSADDAHLLRIEQCALTSQPVVDTVVAGGRRPSPLTVSPPCKKKRLRSRSERSRRRLARSRSRRTSTRARSRRSSSSGPRRRREIRKHDCREVSKSSAIASDASTTNRIRRVSEGRSSAAEAVRAELARRWADIGTNRPGKDPARLIQQSIQTRANSMQRRAQENLSRRAKEGSSVALGLLASAARDIALGPAAAAKQYAAEQAAREQQRHEELEAMGAAVPPSAFASSPALESCGAASTMSDDATQLVIAAPFPRVGPPPKATFQETWAPQAAAIELPVQLSFQVKVKAPAPSFQRSLLAGPLPVGPITYGALFSNGERPIRGSVGSCLQSPGDSEHTSVGTMTSPPICPPIPSAMAPPARPTWTYAGMPRGGAAAILAAHAAVNSDVARALRSVQRPVNGSSRRGGSESYLRLWDFLNEQREGQSDEREGFETVPVVEPVSPQVLQHRRQVEKVLNALREEVLEQDLLHEDDADKCSVCLEPMFPGQKIRRLPCAHTFHSQCITAWFYVRLTCPLDKIPVDDSIDMQMSDAAANEESALLRGVLSPAISASQIQGSTAQQTPRPYAPPLPMEDRPPPPPHPPVSLADLQAAAACACVPPEFLADVLARQRSLQSDLRELQDLGSSDELLILE